VQEATLRWKKLLSARPAPALSEQLLDEITAIAARAAAAIIAFAPSALRPHTKPDRSPVTAADMASEAVILEELSRLLPGVPVVSEETPATRIAGDWFILVDPLDGTKDFLRGGTEFTVNLAVVVNGRPALGVISAPALGLIWRGIVGRGAERLTVGSDGGRARSSAIQPIRTRPAPREGLIVAVSRSHFDPATAAWVERLPARERLICASALKFCRLAEGAADVYPRLSPTSEWDVAAGHALLLAAGGLITAPDCGSLRYGRAEEEFRVPAFIAWGDPEAAERYG
jgi:3'(2'), 5'-bisphosphate nucleotidase